MQALFFDIDDTLYNQVEPYAKAFAAVFGGRISLDISDLFRKSRRHSDISYQEMLAGRMSQEEMFIYRIQKALAEFGYMADTDSCLAFQRCYEACQRQIQVPPATRCLMDHCIQSGIRLGVITNGAHEHQMEKVWTMQLTRWIPTERILISEDCEAAKPDRRIFRQAEKLADVPAEDCCYVGDSWKNDIVGSKQAGWKAIWLNRHSLPLPQDHVADAVVTDDEQLKACVCQMCGAQLI